MLLDCLVYSCFGYWELFLCCLVFILHNSAFMGFFGTSFSYFKIILLYILTVSVLVSTTYLKNTYSFLLENGNKNLHVGTYYSQQTMHENTYACIPDYAYTQLWRFSQGPMCFCLRLKIVYNYDSNLNCFDSGVLTF